MKDTRRSTPGVPRMVRAWKSVQVLGLILPKNVGSEERVTKAQGIVVAMSF